MKLILGSQSPSRQKLLASTGLVFESLNPNIDEKAIRDQDPIKLTQALAHAKADALLTQAGEDALLITSDQVVACNERIFEKPANEAEARLFLESYSLYPADVVTSVVVTNTSTKHRQTGTDIARVWFSKIDPTLVDTLVSDPQTYKIGGGFSVEDQRLTPLIKKIDGTIDSIKGLPLALTKELLEKASH